MVFAVPTSVFAEVTTYGGYYMWDGNGYNSYYQNPKEISIIYTGNMEGKYTAGEEKGSMAKAMTVIAQLRRKAPDSYLIDGGNFTGNSNQFGLALDKSFELKAMETMAYDAVGLGQKELDNGDKILNDNWKEAIRDKVNKKGYFAYPALLCANMDWDGINNGDLKSNFEKFTPKLTYALVEKASSKLAFVSVTEPGKDKNQLKLVDSVKAANDAVKDAKKNKDINGIVCIYNGDDIDAFAGDIEDVDLIIWNPTKQEKVFAEDYEADEIHGVTVVETLQAKGVGHVLLSIEEKGLKLVDEAAYPLDKNVAPNPAIEDLEKEYNKAVDRSYFGKFGYSGRDTLCSNDIDFGNLKDILFGNVNNGFGNLISDAYKYAAEKKLTSGDDIAGAFIAGGTLNDTLSKGKVRVMDVYKLFDKEKGQDGFIGTELVDVYVSGAELKILAEIDASISEKNNDVAIFTSGFGYKYNPHRFARNKVSEVFLLDGDKTPVENRDLYRVVTDTKTIQLIQDANKAPFGLMDIQFKDKDGNPLEDINKAIIKDGEQNLKQWVAVSSYLDRYGISNGYKKAGNRKVLVDDRSLKAIFSNPGKIFMVTLCAGIIGIALLILLLCFVISIIRRALGIQNTSFYKQARKANKQQPIFKHRKNRYKRNMKYRKESWFSRKFKK